LYFCFSSRPPASDTHTRTHTNTNTHNLQHPHTHKHTSACHCCWFCFMPTNQSVYCRPGSDITARWIGIYDSGSNAEVIVKSNNIYRSTYTYIYMYMNPFIPGRAAHIATRLHYEGFRHHTRNSWAFHFIVHSCKFLA